jgi:predicted nucleic acid-binding protein
VLLDTCFFIDLAAEIQSGHRGPCSEFLLRHKRTPKRISVVTLGEYSVGATARETLRFFRGYQPVALGATTAIAAGRLQAALPFEMGENGLWIAATALRFGWPVVTRDGAFSLVPGLKVIGY